MTSYEYEGRASIDMGIEPNQEPRIGVRKLESAQWTADILDDGPAELPEGTVLVTLLEGDHERWFADATFAWTQRDGEQKAMLHGKSQFVPPAR